MSALVNVCFHGIGVPGRTLEPGEEDYWVTQTAFEEVLDVVATDPRVRISFDDGNASDVALGLPALLDRGLSATFFVVAARVEQPGSVSRKDLRTLVDAGMRVGCHGMDHRPWRGLDDHEMQREVVEARDLLAELTDVPIDEAALPLGRYDRRVLSAVRRAGYQHLHTSDRAWARDGAFLQPRYSVRRGDGGSSVRRILDPTPLHRRAIRTAAIAAKRWR